MNAETTVLARRWRPRTFDDMVGQAPVVRALRNALKQGRLHQAYLLTGTRGVGKTTLARLMARGLNCIHGPTDTPCGVCDACVAIEQGRFVDLLEVDAATNTRVEEMRELLENAQYMPVAGRFKVYLIDEVHMLSRSAFNAMLKTLEEPPPHVKFILATTDPQKVPMTVLSRCLQFALRPLPVAEIEARLTHILEAESLPFEPAALPALAQAANGSLRDALSLLDQAIAYGAGTVRLGEVRTMLGTLERPALFGLLAALAAQQGDALIGIAEQMAEQGLSFDRALQELATLFHDLALWRGAPQQREALRLEPELEPLAACWNDETLQLLYQIAVQARRDLPHAPDEAAGFRMALIRLLAFQPGSPPAVGQGPPADVRAPARTIPAHDSQAPGGGVTHPDPSPLQAREPATAPPPSSPPSPEPPPSHGAQPPTAIDDWPALVAHLEGEGMTHELARHAEWLGWEEGVLRLRLAPTHKSLLKYRERLRTALEAILHRDLGLDLTLGEGAGLSVAERAAQAREAERQAVLASLAQDPVIQVLTAHPGITLVESSAERLDPTHPAGEKP